MDRRRGQYTLGYLARRGPCRLWLGRRASKRKCRLRSRESHGCCCFAMGLRSEPGASGRHPLSRRPRQRLRHDLHHGHRALARPGVRARPWSGQPISAASAPGSPSRRSCSALLVLADGRAGGWRGSQPLCWPLQVFAVSYAVLARDVARSGPAKKGAAADLDRGRSWGPAVRLPGFSASATIVTSDISLVGHRGAMAAAHPWFEGRRLALSPASPPRPRSPTGCPFVRRHGSLSIVFALGLA